MICQIRQLAVRISYKKVLSKVLQIALVISGGTDLVHKWVETARDCSYYCRDTL